MSQPGAGFPRSITLGLTYSALSRRPSRARPTPSNSRMLGSQWRSCRTSSRLRARRRKPCEPRQPQERDRRPARRAIIGYPQQW
jgi:hypothetical protein